ncbi:MAG: hypothetical protein ABW046_22485 [Actinoplanes sp.]
MSENDITIVVDADNRTTASFGAAARGANTVGDAVNNANRAFREADNRYQQASLRLQQLALRQREAAERAERLAHEQLQLRTSIAAAGTATAEQLQRLQRLTREQDQATVSARLLASQHRSSTEQVNDLARAYQRAQRNAQEALRASLMFGAASRLGPDGSVSAGGRGGNDSGPGVITRMLGRLPGLGGLAATAGTGAAGAGTSNPVVGASLIAGGAGLASLLAPFLGGAVTGAIGAGAGIGGVGLGIAGALANDPKGFEQQWTGVTERVTARWLRASATWVLPLHESIGEIDKAFRRLPIEDVLRDSAGYLAPLTKGLVGFANNLTPGLSALVREARPVIDVLGTRLPKLGTDVGDFFASIGAGSEGGAKALDDLLYAVGRLTKGLGGLLGGLAQMYDGLTNVYTGFEHATEATFDWVGSLVEGMPMLEQAYNWIKRINEEQDAQDADVPAFAQRLPGAPPVRAVDPLTGEAEKVPKVFGAATAAVDDYLSKLEELRSVAAGSANANVALAQGWLDLSEELKDGKKTLDLTTQAGIDNQKALIDQAMAAEAARQAGIALNGVTEEGEAAYAANIERIKQMAYALGFNKEQVDNLIDGLRVLDTTKAKPTIDLNAGAAYNWASKTKALLDGIAGTYNVKIAVSAPAGISVGNLQHHAIGGPTSPGLSVVNEWGGQGGMRGGEVMSLPTGSMVYGGARARGGDGGGSSGGPQQITLEIVSDGSSQGDWIADQLAKTARVRANGDLQLAVVGRKAPN